MSAAWLPPTLAEVSRAELAVDAHKHDGAAWWDGFDCDITGCVYSYWLSRDRGRMVGMVARHLAWHARGVSAA